MIRLLSTLWLLLMRSGLTEIVSVLRPLPMAIPIRFVLVLLAILA